MASLIDRSAASGCAIMLPRDGELEQLDMHTRAFSVFRLPDGPDGRRCFRIGGSVGPTRYRTDPYRDERWKPIDMALQQTAGDTPGLACDTCRYQSRVYPTW